MMRLPDTSNAHHIHAFKRGYRLAMDGKTLSNMPSQFRHDHSLRSYYEMGWSQANEDIGESIKANQKVPWRNRIAWFVVFVIGSIATAAGLIQSVEEERQEQEALILGLDTGSSNPQLKPEVYQPPSTDKVVPKVSHEQVTEPEAPLSLDKTEKEPASLPAEQPDQALEEEVKTETPAVAETQATNTKSEEEAPLSLLTQAQRQDLTLNRKEQGQRIEIALAEISDSNIIIELATLTEAINNKQATTQLGESIPKSIRKLYFFTQVQGAQGQKIYHRWLYKNQVMALIPLQINSNLYRTWSSKRLASAWQGTWHVEVLDAQKRVLHRHTFTYGRSAQTN